MAYDNTRGGKPAGGRSYTRSNSSYNHNGGQGGYKSDRQGSGEGQNRSYYKSDRTGSNGGQGGYKSDRQGSGEGQNRSYYKSDRTGSNGGQGGYKSDRQGSNEGQNRSYYKSDRTGSNGGQGGYKSDRQGSNERSNRPYGGERRDFGSPQRGAYGGRPAKPAISPKMPENAPVPPAIQAGGDDTEPYLIIGRNAVREAVKSGRSINSILVIPEQDGSLREIIGLARDEKIVVKDTERRKLDELCMPFGHGGKTANHQGIVAYAAGVEYCEVRDILNLAKERGEQPFVIVLDGIEDPHNLGSIIRSAECAGAHGVIIGKRRSASVTAAAVKASAGATEHMKIARVVNITNTLTELKRAGLWIAGADMEGRPMNKQGLNGALALVIGSEGEGLSKLVKDSCDFLIAIPMFGKLDSLNAGVAAAVLMYEKRRQDALPENKE